MIRALAAVLALGDTLLTGGHPRDPEGLEPPALEQLAAAKVIRPVIDRCYRLEQMAQAHRYIDGGHKKGNVVVTVST